MGQRDQHQDGPAGHPAPAYRGAAGNTRQEKRVAADVRRRSSGAPGRPGAPSSSYRLLVVLRVVDLVIDLVVEVVVAGVGFQRLALLQTVGVELARAGVRDPIGVSLLRLSWFLGHGALLSDGCALTARAGPTPYDSNAGERSAPGFSSAGSKRVKGFTLPRAAVTESPTPGWRARSAARNARISPRTLGLSEHAQPTVVRPRARV